MYSFNDMQRFSSYHLQGFEEEDFLEFHQLVGRFYCNYLLPKQTVAAHTGKHNKTWRTSGWKPLYYLFTQVSNSQYRQRFLGIFESCTEQFPSVVIRLVPENGRYFLWFQPENFQCMLSQTGRWCHIHPVRSHQRLGMSSHSGPKHGIWSQRGRV